MNNKILTSFCLSKDYCKKNDYKGWDPYDGLNSKIFQLTPLKKSSLARIYWIQLFKRFPINLRRIFRVPKTHNAKGIALFLTGYCNLYQIINKDKSNIGNLDEIRNEIKYLADLLLSLRSDGYSGDCWGYDFDWQSKAFFLPKNTPTVVVSSFAVEALINAYKVLKDEIYLNSALSCSNFVLNDLNRIKKDKGFMFSYSPLDDRAVYNASLLGTKILSMVYSYTRDPKLKEIAFITAKEVCDTQHANGAFPHSDQVGNKWRDSFHTGFKIESLFSYQKYCNDNHFDININKAVDYWLKNFFKSNGEPNYYDDSRYLIDLHCTAQFFPTLYKTNNLKENKIIAEKVALWSIDNMFDTSKGLFYFQKTKIYLNKSVYMRWPQAWMFYGLSYWLMFNFKSNEDN